MTAQALTQREREGGKRKPPLVMIYARSFKERVMSPPPPRLQTLTIG